jgi:phosphoesterase RecJ-like protein
MAVATFEQAGRELEGWRRVAILTHDRPDGDALGAIGAMKRIIAGRGGQAEAFLYREVAAQYKFLAEACGLAMWPATGAEVETQFDGIVILDTCSWSQLDPVAAFLRETRLPKIIVDHHATRDDLTAKSPRLVGVFDETSASACGLVFEWAKAMNWAPDAPARDALFVGLATDTGWFRFPSTDGRTLRAVGELIDAGVRPDIMYARLFEGYRPARLRLLREALDTMRLLDQGTISIMWLTRAMFLLSDAVDGDSEDMVNAPLSIGSVIVSVLLSEMEDGVIRINFRSRSPEIVGRDVDVSAMARQYGGGGHKRAAGARAKGKLDEIREKVIETVRETMKRQ